MCHKTREQTLKFCLERLETRAREEFCLRCGDNRRIRSPVAYSRGRFELLRKGWLRVHRGRIAATAASAGALGESESSLFEHASIYHGLSGAVCVKRRKETESCSLIYFSGMQRAADGEL